MSTTKQDGGTAFPFTPTDRSGQCGECFPGMTIRDWFAGQALDGLNASMAGCDEFPTPEAIDAMAKLAYKLADAMIAERGRLS